MKKCRYCARSEIEIISITYHSKTKHEPNRLICLF